MTLNSQTAPTPTRQTRPNPDFRPALPGGSRVLTAKGEVQVESLKAGDRIITRDFGMVVIRDMVRRTVSEGAPMVRIPANALGQGKPERDITLPARQPITVQGWRAETMFNSARAQVAAERLVDGTIVRSVPSKGESAWSIILDEPATLYVDGLNVFSGSLDTISV